MGYVIFQCSAEGCRSETGYYVRDVDAEGWAKWHGYYDPQEHTLRKVGESEVDPTAHLSLFERPGTEATAGGR